MILDLAFDIREGTLDQKANSNASLHTSKHLSSRGKEEEGVCI